MTFDPKERQKLTLDMLRAKPSTVKVYRDTRVRRAAVKQILLYSPCPCGSGKKFKFCCNVPKVEPLQVTGDVDAEQAIGDVDAQAEDRDDGTGSGDSVP